MDRHTKVLKMNHIDKRELGYYYTPRFIADYISSRLLMLNPDGKKVLDPSVGQEELLENFFKNKKSVDGIDVYKHKDNYQCNFIQQDFIKYYSNVKKKEITHKLLYSMT